MIQSSTVPNTLKQSENQGSAVLNIIDWIITSPKIKRRRKTDAIELVSPAKRAGLFDGVNNIITTNMEDII